MGIIIDIVIILFILASIYLGYKKGLISLGIQLLAFILSLIITLILYRPIGSMIINTTQLDEKLQEIIQVNAESLMSEESDNKITNELIESTKNGMLPEVSRSLAINIIYGITMIVLFIVSRICLIFIKSLSDMIAKLPIINQFNKLGGVLYGLLRGLLITYAIVMIMNLMITFNPKGSLNDIMNETYLAKMISQYSIFRY